MLWSLSGLKVVNYIAAKTIYMALINNIHQTKFSEYA